MPSPVETSRTLRAGSFSSPPPPSWLGQTIDGRYAIERQIGEGGMGLVFGVRHAVLNRPFAMKILRPEASSNPDVLARFMREAESTSAIGNEHIVDVFDFGLTPDGATYFVMELLEGRTLGTALKQDGPFAFDRAVHIAMELADALGAAHGVGVVHRDLKPENIFLVRRGDDPDFVKVVDFGIAKVLGAASKLTQRGQVVGTPHYMSPEQCQGLAIDGRSDIYALGVILFELLTGRLPFEAENVLGLLAAHVMDTPPAIASLRPDCPHQLEELVQRCLMKDPAHRHPSCEALVADLEAFRQGRPSLAPRMSGIVSTSARTLPPPSESEAPAERRSSRRVFVAAGTIAFAGLCALGLAVILRRGESTRSPLTPPVLPILEAVASPAIAESEAAPIPTESIRLESNPSGAEVLDRDQILGVTPLDIPRVPNAEPRTLVLRALGHEPKEFVLTDSTVGNVLRVELAPLVGQGRTSRGGNSSPSSVSSGEAESPQPIQDARPETRRSPTDVINPWDN